MLQITKSLKSLFFFMSDTKSIKNSLISKCSITVLCLVLVSPAEFNFGLVSVQLVRSHLEPTQPIVLN